MNAAEIAQAVFSRGTTTNGEQIVCVDALTIEDVQVLCCAILDAEAYRVRVERMALEMRNEHPPHARAVEWAEQLKEKGNG